MKRYFRRTDQSVLLTLDTKALKIQANYGTEGSVGDENTQTNEEILEFKSEAELTAGLDKKIESLLDLGYIETKEQEKFPSNLTEFYEEDVMAIAIEDLEKANDVNHFSLVTWEESYEEAPDKILNYLIEQKDKYQTIEHFTFGNMNYEECEMSWITQSTYSNFFKAFPNIKSFTVQGSTDLELGIMNLPKLEILEVIGSGLTEETLNHIMQSNLPNLKKLNIYVGDANYGCNVTTLDIKEFLNKTNYTNLINLGICNMDSYIFSDVLESIIDSKYANQIKVLDISKSVSRDEDAMYLLDNIDKLSNLKYIDLNYNFFTSDILKKLEDCKIEINISGNEELDLDEDGDDCSGPMYTE